MDLLGRPGELAACENALSADAASGAAAIITGPPGIGKTSLWRAVAAGWPRSGTVVLRTTGVPGAGTALSGLADLVDPLTETAIPELPAPLADALLAAVGQAPPRSPVTSVLLERALVRLCRGLAESGLLIAVDDEQWLDEDSRRLLATAAVRLADVPVRWLVGVRSDSAHSAHRAGRAGGAHNAGRAGEAGGVGEEADVSDANGGLARVLAHELGPGAVRIDLAGLPGGALSELVVSRFPGGWSAGVLRQVCALADGSPYAALEIARETVARGERDGTAAQVPPGLTVAVRHHLERLGPAALAVVQAAALVAGPTRDLLRAVAGDSAGEHVTAALEAGVLTAAPPVRELGFAHPLLREAAESMLAETRRRELHRLIGAALDDGRDAAWHLARGAEEPDEELAKRLEEAVTDAAVRGASARATVLARYAVELTPDAEGLDGWRRRLLWLTTMIHADEYGRARRQGAQWEAEVPAPLRASLAILRAHVEPDAEVHYELLVSGLAEAGQQNPGLAALAYAEAAIISAFLLGRLDQGRRFAAAAVPLARAAGYAPLTRGVLGADALLAALAGEPEAGPRLHEAAALPGFEESPLPYETPEVTLAAWHVWRGELAAARELMLPVLALAEQLAVGGCLFNASIALADIELRAGNWAVAQVHADAAARWSRESGAGWAGPHAFVQSAILAGQGDVPQARALAADGLLASEAKRDWGYAAHCRWVLGQLELSVDDPAAARRWLEPVSDMLQASGIADPGSYPFTPDLIEAWAATGNLEPATERLKWLQEAARRLGQPWARVAGGRAAAVLRLAQRDPAGAIEVIGPAVAEARTLGLRLEIGRGLLILGTAQRKDRRRREAAATLDEAVATFRDLGAPRWQELAAAQRARLGAYPGRGGSDDSALTPAERRVAELVAAGHSNPEIAANLFISVKTVEANLTRIYRKLGLRGRVDLARRDLS